jgi:hypothetical protein
MGCAQAEKNAYRRQRPPTTAIERFIDAWSDRCRPFTLVGFRAASVALPPDTVRSVEIGAVLRGRRAGRVRERTISGLTISGLT